VVISHDRWFLDRIATHMLAFEGDSHVEWFEGNFQDYEDDKKRRWGSIPSSRTGSNTRSSNADGRLERQPISEVRGSTHASGARPCGADSARRAAQGL
jgi:hypothetical protein